jgi:hypothetical protein
MRFVNEVSFGSKSRFGVTVMAQFLACTLPRTSTESAFSIQVDLRPSEPLHTGRLPGTILLDVWIGDLPLIAEVVANQLAKTTCPTVRQYIEHKVPTAIRIRRPLMPGPPP